MNRRRILLLLADVAFVGAYGYPCTSLLAQEQTDAARRARPQPQQMVVENLPPRLEQVLKEWHAESQKIEKLQGNHMRWVYDSVFMIAKRSKGEFYYESPDKGRLDIYADKSIAEGATIPYGDKEYQLKSDTPEIWICDGKEIVQLDPVLKQGESFQIPQQNQGQNIMDGPLPFLFGMKPEQAKRRYKMELTKETADHVWLHVRPRWKSDAANYREAWLILAKPSYLPMAVRLIDPAGNLETNYRFSDVHANKQRTIFQAFTDPFKTDRRGYKIKVNVPTQAQAPQSPPPVPSFVNLSWLQIQKLLKQHKYEIGKTVVFHKGKAPDDPNLHLHCYAQDPPPNSLRKADEKLQLVLYYDQTQAAAQAKPRAQAAKR